jgi:hypothetical protein
MDLERQMQWLFAGKRSCLAAGALISQDSAMGKPMFPVNFEK